MEELLEGVGGIFFLSPYYLRKEIKETRRRKKKGKQKIEYSWKRFFEIIGVWSSPRVVKDPEGISIAGIDKYKWVEKQYSPSGMHELHGNSRSEDIEKLVEYCSKIAIPGENRARMALLWESLDKNWRYYRDKGYCSTTYKWFYHSGQLRSYATSSFLEFLKGSRWVPGRDGDFHKPGDVLVYNQENLALLGDGSDFVELKANEAFLKDLGVKIKPKTSEVLAHLNSFRKNNPEPEDNKVDKMKVVYGFLQEELEAIGTDAGKQAKIEEMKRDFDNHELFYLPREDRAWWKPRRVFWDDFSEQFEVLRGYVENNGDPIYDVSLRPYFSSLGVIEKPSLEDCFGIIEDLKATGNLDYYKKFISKTYFLINAILKQKRGSDADWERPIFLSERGNFLSPSSLYYGDNEEYKRLFGANVETILLPFHWDNVKEMLRIGGFKRLSENISVAKRFGSLNEIEGDISGQLIKRLLCVKSYLKEKKFELFNALKKDGIFSRIEKLQSFETQTILLDFLLDLDGPEPIAIRDVKKDAYYSGDENRLYKSVELSLFSTSVAKELSELFAPAEDEVFSVLDSLFGATDEEDLNKKLGHFGIQEPVKQEEEFLEGIKIVKEKKGALEKKAEKAVIEEGPGRKPKPPEKDKPEIPRYDLVDPDAFIFENAELKTPYAKTDGSQNLTTKTIWLRKAHEGRGYEREHKPREKPNRVDAEAIALELVMRFEEDFEDRGADDRHEQPGIGYDILSTDKDGDERHIEVKHFRGDAGTWELTPHQWKKAEEEGDKYFVYIVSGLRLGYTPNIEIIQNPVKYLTVDPPSQKRFSEWKNGVLKVVKSLKT
jgi:hypothetical protein